MTTIDAVQPSRTRRRRIRGAAVLGALASSDRPLSMVELTEQRFVTYPPESVMYRMTADLCREAGFQHRVSQMAQETSTILSFVAGKKALHGIGSTVPNPLTGKDGARVGGVATAATMKMPTIA